MRKPRKIPARLRTAMRGMLRAAVKVECDSKRAFEAEFVEDSAMKFTRITVDPKQMTVCRASADCAFPSPRWSG